MKSTRRKESRRKASRILRLLEVTYGPRKWRPGRSPVDVLVGTILSQSTNSANSSAGFKNLKKRFGSWEAVAEAPVGSIASCIRVGGLARQKAPRIRKILRRIRSDRGRVSLQFLRKLPAEQAYEYLIQFDGVGPKTALCVLMFSFGMAVFPVDTHIYRLARRLGLLDEETPASKAHEVLAPMIAPADRYAMHLLLIAHGRAVCKARAPGCGDCCLLGLCPHGKQARGG
ncbi:MAG: endonuclease III domain-containing protein [Planctomycetota bacterium]